MFDQPQLRGLQTSGNGTAPIDGGRPRSRRHARKVAPLLLIALIAAACGSGGNKSRTSASAVPNATTDVTSSAGETSSTTIDTAGSSTSTVPSANVTTATTAAKKAVAATTKTTTKTVTTRPFASTSQGLVQVTAPPTTASSTDPPQPGGTLTALEVFDSSGFDPVSPTDLPALNAVYSSLVLTDPVSGQVVPGIAESLTSSDGKTWTLKVRPNVKFTDGSPLDANAVKYNWDRNLDPANASLYTTQVKSFTSTVVDSVTLRLVLTQVNSQFPRIVQLLGYIGSPTAIQTMGAAAFASKPVGAGPFILQSWVRQSQYTFVRNPNYWDAPRPYLDRLILRPVTEEQQRINSLKAGEADWVFTTTPATASSLASFSTVTGIPSLGTALFSMNNARPPFNDPNARKAIQLAIDIDQIGKTVWGSSVAPPHTFLPTGSPFSDPTLTLPGNDLATAQSLVNTWVQANGGKDLEFTFTTSNAGDFQQEAQVIQQNVQRLQHVKMNIQALSSAGLITVLRAKDFDAFIQSYSGSDPDSGNNSLSAITHSASATDFISYKNSGVDALIDDSRTTLDGNQRVNDFKQVQKLLLGDMPFVPLHRSTPFIAYRKGVVGATDHFNDAAPLFDAVWIRSH